MFCSWEQENTLSGDVHVWAMIVMNELVATGLWMSIIRAYSQNVNNDPSELLKQLRQPNCGKKPSVRVGRPGYS